MAADLTWVFTLLDKASGPANKVAAALHNSVVQLEDAKNGTTKLSAAQAKAINVQNRVIANYARFVRGMQQVASVQQKAQALQQRAISQDLQRAKTLALVTVAQTKAATAASRAQAAQSRAAAAPHLAAAAAAKAQATQTRLLMQQQRQAFLTANGAWHGTGGSPGGGGGGHGLFGTALGVAGLYVSFRAITAGLTAVARGLTALPRYVIGQGIAATAEKEAMVAALEMQLGSKSRAEGVIGEAVRFAALTPLTSGETMKGYQQFIMAGMDPSKVQNTMAAVSDLASLSGSMRGEATEGITRALVQTMAAGRFTGEEARQLRNWMFPIGEFYKELASGMIPALAGASPDLVKKAVENGQISAEATLLGFRRVMASKGGGMLGGLSEKGSRTMLGLWSTLTSRPQELFMQMDKTPAWDKLKTSLENLNRLLDVNSPTGAKVQAVLADAFSRWVDKLTSWLSDPAKVESWIKSIIAGFERIVPAFENMAGHLATIAGHLDKVFKFVDLSAKAVPGYGAANTVIGDAQKLIGGSAVGGWLRQNLGAPVNEGTSGAAGWLNRSFSRGVDALSSPFSSGAKGSKPVSVGDMHFHFGPGTSREDAKVIGDEVRKALASVFEQSALEAGV